MRYILTITLLLMTTVRTYTAEHKLVDVTKLDPTIRVDLIYKTDRNFTGKVVYPASAKAYLLEDVAQALAAVQKDLKKLGLGLLIWDALRTNEAQAKFWEICPDPRYVMPPGKGSRHTRGTTVDVTLVRLADGTQLEMPSEFDDFSERAWSSNEKASAEAKKNRALLQETMQKHGFEKINTEWWHFDYQGWQERPVLLTVSFDELAQQ